MSFDCIVATRHFLFFLSVWERKIHAWLQYKTFRNKETIPFSAKIGYMRLMFKNSSFPTILRSVDNHKAT